MDAIVDRMDAGKPYDGVILFSSRSMVSRLLKLDGISHLRRHSAASLLLAQGADLPDVTHCDLGRPRPQA